MRFISRAALGGGLFLHICTSPAWAVAFDAGDAYLDEVVVTASRLRQPVGHSIQHSTVIDEEAIRLSLAPDLTTLLRQQTGIEITQSGGLGTQASLFLRGTNSNHTLVLLDGMRIDSATTGATALDQIMLTDIERIEIVRGNMSALYGSSAIGGVIQIFTKKGRGTPGGVVETGLGSYATRTVHAAYGGQTAQTRFHLGLARRYGDGFSAVRREFIPAAPVPFHPFTPADTDDDGYRNTTLTLNLGHTFRPGQTLSALARVSRGRVEYDGSFSNRSEQELDAYQLTSDNRITEGWVSRLMLALGRDRLDSFLDGTGAGHVQTRTRQAEWHNSLSIAPGQEVTAGVGLVVQKVASDTAYTRTRRQVRHLSLGYAGEFGRHAWQLNARHDDYSDFGGHASYLAGYGLELTPHWRLIANASTAFRAPTFNDLYAPPAWGGNPNLRPEKARSWEAGLQYARSGFSARLVHFDTRTKDLIAYVWPVGNRNVNRARSDGWEGSLNARVEGFDLQASLTLQDPRDATTGVSLLRRAKRLGSVSLARSVGRWSFMAELKASGARRDIHVTSYTPVRTAGYTVANLSGRYQLEPGLSLEARVDNLFDREYSLVHGYNTAGRSVFVQLEWQF